MSLPFGLIDKDRVHVLQRMEDAMARVVSEFPFLAGMVVPFTQPNGRSNALQVRPVTATEIEECPILVTQHPTESTAVAVDGKLNTALMPFPIVYPPRNLSPVLRLKANLLENKLYLVCCFDHRVMDGSGFFRLAATFAAFCRDLNAPVPFTTAHAQETRQHIKEVASTATPQDLRWTTFPAPASENEISTDYNRMPISSPYVLDGRKIKTLRGACNLALQTFPGKYRKDLPDMSLPSSLVVSALVGICSSRARLRAFPDEPEFSSETFIVENIRKALDLRRGYMGNTIVGTQSKCDGSIPPPPEASRNIHVPESLSLVGPEDIWRICNVAQTLHEASGHLNKQHAQVRHSTPPFYITLPPNSLPVLRKNFLLNSTIVLSQHAIADSAASPNYITGSNGHSEISLMSSMAEGSEGWSREDELDLGQEDDTQQPDHGALDQTLPSPQEPAEEQLDTIDDAEDHDSEKTAEQKDFNFPETPRPRHAGWNMTESVDGTGSNPDDSPSLHGSIPSSLSSSALALRGTPRVSPSPARRPFDLRFQSRLSSSPQSVSRAGSPFLAHLHSRQSSITSQVSPTPETEPEPLQGPWDVVRWTKLRKITGQAFSEIGKRNFGRPTCLAVSTSIVIGTSKGIILVFDYQQSLKTIIGTGTPAVGCGAVTSLALSADHTTVAGGHDSGDIFTWEISRSAKPFLHIPPIPANQVETRISDGHLSGSAVIHIGFLGTRRTALVSADTRGMSFSHLATRGMGAMGRTVKTIRILGRYPQATAEIKRRKPSSVLAFSPLPLGNVEQSTDSLGLVAMLTPYLLVIVSTTPVAQTQHKAPRPKEVPAHSAMTGALAWFPAIRLKGKDTQTSNTKLVYCWSNVLTVLEVSEAEPDEHTDKDKPPSLVFRARSRWRADEAIVAVQWLSRSVLAVFTITQRLLIIEDYSMHVTDSVDLANRHIYHTDLFSSQLHSLVEQLDEEDESMHGVVADAFHMSFRSYKGRLFLLGYNEALVGNLSNWADRLLALMETGDFIGAIRLATSYYTGESEKLTVGLPEEDALRQPIVQEKLLEMISASLKYAFGRNSEASNDRLENHQLEELAEVSIAACIYMTDEEFLWEEVFNWYEEQSSAGIFLDALEPRIVDGTLRSLPPTAVKALINHFIGTHSAGRLEEIICLLDTTTMDIDQVTTLCKQHNLYDAFIYVWNRCLMDYVGPLEELLGLIPSQTEPLVNGDYVIEMRKQNNAMKMFPYLSFILTGRIYPTGDDMDEAEAARAKTDLYQFLFSGRGFSTVSGDTNGADSFSHLRAMLKFDASSFMSMLNEAFEDSFLNEPESEDVSVSGMSINRQYLVSILLQVMTGDFFTSFDTIYLDMFVARNLPKYPQYILLSGTTLHQVLVRVCQYPEQEMADDCELSAEYLLSFYHPPDIQNMIPLFKEARFFRILKSTYRLEKQYPLLVMTYLEDPNDREAIFTCLHDCLRPGSGLGKKQRRDIVDVVKEHAREIAAIDVTRAAQTMQDLAPETHSTFLRVLEDDPQKQYQYLLVLVEPQAQTADTQSSPSIENWMIERYVQLLCKYNPTHVADFVDGLRVGDIHLDELLPFIEESGAIDAAVILLARQGQVRQALDRLVAHLSTLESGLVGILQSVRESPDSATTAEAIDDLIESLNKYAGVGTWLCQGQSKTVKQSRTGSSNGKRNAPTLDQPLAFDELLWLDHIEAVVRIASNVFAFIQGNNAQITLPTQPTTSLAGESGRLTTSFRTLVQQVFTALLASTVKSSPATTERTDMSFLRILRAFLTRAATWSPSLLELRAVLASIFSAYSYEKSLLTLANGMLDRDLFVHVDEVSRLRQHGWRPRGHVCEICRRRIWGPSVGDAHWSAWEGRRADAYARRIAKRNEDSYNPSERGKGKAADVGVGHSYRLDAGGAHAHAHVLREHGTHGGMSDAHADHDDDHAKTGAGPSTPNPVTESAPEPVVVFACRHLYHRRCVLNAVSAGARPAQTAFRRDHLADWSGAELFCPVCT